MIGEILATMVVAHGIGDYWIQSERQATEKEHDAMRCVLHVLTYCLTQLVFLWVLALVTGWQPTHWGMFTSLVITAVTHYVADRRAPLRRLAELLGKSDFVERGGLPLLDQAWHLGWLFPAAIALATL